MNTKIVKKEYYSNGGCHQVLATTYVQLAEANDFVKHGRELFIQVDRHDNTRKLLQYSVYNNDDEIKRYEYDYADDGHVVSRMISTESCFIKRFEKKEVIYLYVNGIAIRLSFYKNRFRLSKLLLYTECNIIKDKEIVVITNGPKRKIDTFFNELVFNSDVCGEEITYDVIGEHELLYDALQSSIQNYKKVSIKDVRVKKIITEGMDTPLTADDCAVIALKYDIQLQLPIDIIEILCNYMKKHRINFKYP